jgi:hypothetical protein
MRRRWSFWLFLAAMLCFANMVNAAESQEVKKLSLEVSSDFDFDSNATQQNNLPADVATTGKRSSIVYTQTLKAQYDLNPAGPFNLQAKYEYFQNFHTHAGFVDTMYHTWFLTPSYLLGVYRNIKVWLPCTFNYTDVGSNKYFTSFTVAPNLFHRFSKTMGYGVELRLGRRYGWLPQEFPQFYDYTSRGIGGSLGYYYFLDNGGYLQVRFNYDYVGARGSNNSASRYGLTLSGEYPLTPKFNFLLFLDLALQNNDNVFQQGRTVIFQNVPPNVLVLLPVPPESVFPKRTDKNMLLGVIATMKIYRGLEGNMHYYYTRHNSNIPFYDYTSHIVGAQLAYKY